MQGVRVSQFLSSLALYFPLEKNLIPKKDKPFRNPKIPDTEPRPGLKAYRARTPGKGNRSTLFQKFAKKETAKKREKLKETLRKQEGNLSETLKFSDTELLPGLKANRARTPGRVS